MKICRSDGSWNKPFPLSLPRLVCICAHLYPKIDTRLERESEMNGEENIFPNFALFAIEFSWHDSESLFMIEMWDVIYTRVCVYSKKKVQDYR